MDCFEAAPMGCVKASEMVLCWGNMLAGSKVVLWVAQPAKGLDAKWEGKKEYIGVVLMVAETVEQLAQKWVSWKGFRPDIATVPLMAA